MTDFVADTDTVTEGLVEGETGDGVSVTDSDADTVTDELIDGETGDGVSDEVSEADSDNDCVCEADIDGDILTDGVIEGINVRCHATRAAKNVLVFKDGFVQQLTNAVSIIIPTQFD